MESVKTSSAEHHGPCAPRRRLDWCPTVRVYRKASLPLATLACIFTLAMPHGDRAAETETITGSVVDGTAGASSPHGLTVTLVGVDQSQKGVSLPAVPVNDTRRFACPPVQASAGITYAVSTEYAGVSYVSAVSKPDGGGSAAVPLTVYEPTASDATIGVDMISWLLGTNKCVDGRSPIAVGAGN